MHQPAEIRIRQSMRQVKLQRKSIRFKEYDYKSAGEYFVAICTYKKECTFGEVAYEEMKLSQTGEIVKEEWIRTGIIRSNVKLDSFVIMPNHIHGIIILNEINDNYSRVTSS